MKNWQCSTSSNCHHRSASKPDGLALIILGNPLRGDDGVGQAVCNLLPDKLTDKLCRFDLGPFSNLIIDCLSKHQKAIIIDSTWNETAPGTVMTLDLIQMLEERLPLRLASCHGFSLLNELQLADNLKSLPSVITFFGIEVGHALWGEELSPELATKLPGICRTLSDLIQCNLKGEAAGARSCHS